MNKKIDLLMTINNIPIPALANIVGISVNTLNNRLNEKSSWRTLEAVKIAKYFNISMGELIDGNYPILRLKV